MNFVEVMELKKKKVNQSCQNRLESHESNRPTMGLVQVGLKFFYKLLYGLIFDSVHLEEPDSLGLKLW